MLQPLPNRATHITNRDSLSSPAIWKERIELTGVQPIAFGAQQNVFVHPAEPTLLIKIARDRSHLRTPWFKRRRSRYGTFRGPLNEIAEFAALVHRNPEDTDLIERVVGIVDTDLGFGLAVEALRDSDGNIAPTLYQLIRRGQFDEKLQDELVRFAQRILHSDLVAYDLKCTNIVRAHDDASGVSRFVLVDGIGERLSIPVNALVPPLNRFNKSRRIKRLHREVANLLAHFANEIDQDQ